jgi:protein-disulfide isomerase
VSGFRKQADADKSTADEAQKLGLQATPSFFLNGLFFMGSLSYDQMRQMMEDELNRSAVQARKGQPVTAQ